MRIGLFRKNVIKKIAIEYNDGSYMVYGDSIFIGSLLQNEYFDLTETSSGLVQVKKGTSILGNYNKVLFVQNFLNTSMVLSPKIPAYKQRKYKDNLEVSKDISGLKIVNVVDINNYLAGVIESEGGGGRDLEYYKVQAVMSRTSGSRK